MKNLFYALFLFSLFVTATAQNPRYYGQIDPEETRQTMYGWGISSAFHPARYIYERIPEDERIEIFDLLFTESGANLNIFRTQIEPEFDYKTWGEEVDKYQYLIMQEARKRGVTEFLATPWSPPGEFKANGKAAPGEDEEALSKNYLLPNKYQEYADYLARYVKGYEENRGIKFSAFSVQNEPDMNYIWNTCFFYPWMLTDLVNVVGKTFEENEIDLIFLAPECGGWNLTKTYADTIFADPTAGYYLDGISTHGYKSSSQRNRVAEIASENGLAHIWQTESSDYNENIQEPQDGIDNGILWAKNIALDLTDGGATAWFYWWAVVFSAKDGQGLLRWSGGEPTIPKRFWAMAHYSRFARKGWKRIEIGEIEEKYSELTSTAFVSPETDTIALVLINESTLPASASYVAPIVPGAVYEPEIRLTNSDYNFEKPENSFVVASENAIRFDDIPARSIVTAICPIPEPNSGSLSLIEPEDGASAKVGEEIFFKWDVADCDKYRIVISKSPDVSIDSDASEFTVQDNFFAFTFEEFSTNYFWRVEALVEEEGVYKTVATSDVSNVKTLPEPPGLVKVLRPSDDYEIALGEEVTFLWLQASGYDTAYRLIISENEDLSDVPARVLDSVSEFTRINFSAFPGVGEYFWAVAAENEGGFGDFTEVRSLSVLEPLSVEEVFDILGSVEVYPNPGGSEIFFKIETNKPIESIKIKIIDESGRVFEPTPRSTTNIDGGALISLENSFLSSGAYTAIFEVNEAIYKAKFVIAE